MRLLFNKERYVSSYLVIYLLFLLLEYFIYWMKAHVSASVYFYHSQFYILLNE